ncbi:T-cell surface antigen CD2 isoform X2 [Ascaphus truei]|uniref:T-cell surface antigen CD2 isoform X2 n=1 Tax=Ascaphus truei TaxID=8439 RepID=UPI003F598FA2
MQPRGTLPLSVWGGIWLLLLTDAAEKPPVYAALHDSVQLDIPKYPNAENYQVTWTDASSTKIAWFKNNDKITYSNEDLCNCTLHKNGSLYIKSMDTKGEIHYKVEVYNKETGKGLSTEVIKVIVQEKVKEPTLTYNCTTKKINCIATAGSDPKIQITWDKKPMTEWKVGSPVDITFKDKTGTVTCSVKNVVSQMSRTENIKCHQELDIFLMLSIAGAAAAFLIFLILLGYCVRRRMANTRRIRQHRADGERRVGDTRLNPNTQRRELPEPPTQTSAGPHTVPRPIPEAKEYRPVDREPPHQRLVQPVPPHHARRTPNPNHSQKGPQLQEQGERDAKRHTQHVPDPAEKPALPSNHPTGQPPRPQHRKQAKPPRQHRNNY